MDLRHPVMSSEVCYSFYSPYLNDKIREVVSDCALPISVVIFSFIGSYLFLDIQRENSFNLFRPFSQLTAELFRT